MDAFRNASFVLWSPLNPQVNESANGFHSIKKQKSFDSKVWRHQLWHVWVRRSFIPALHCLASICSLQELDVVPWTAPPGACLTTTALVPTTLLNGEPFWRPAGAPRGTARQAYDESGSQREQSARLLNAGFSPILASSRATERENGKKKERYQCPSFVLTVKWRN